MSKVTVLLPDAEFFRLDKYCERRGFKKSTLIARLIRDHLDEELSRAPLKEAPLPRNSSFIEENE